MSIENLRKRALLTLRALKHPTVLGLSETFGQDPSFGEKISFYLNTRYDPLLEYEDIIESPNCGASATEVSAIYEEVFDHLEDGTPIVVYTECLAAIPQEVLTLLIKMGKVKTEVQEAYAYETLRCD